MKNSDFHGVIALVGLVAAVMCLVYEPPFWCSTIVLFGIFAVNMRRAIIEERKECTAEKSEEKAP